MKPTVIIISAMTRDRVIGDVDGMPWNIPAEYQHFLDSVRGQAIVMGRRSYEIFGPDLTTLYNYVLTRRGGQFENATCVGELDAAISLASQHGVDVYIGGGASVYEQALDRADRMILSYIKGDFAGDAHFPPFEKANWTVATCEDRGPYELVDYRRRVV